MPQPAVIGRLAEQDSPAIAVHVDSWVRRGRDYLQMGIAARSTRPMLPRPVTRCAQGTQICAPLGAAPAGPRGPYTA